MLVADRAVPATDGGEGASFIELSHLALPDAGLPFVLAKFQLARFRPALFDEHAITFPDHIRNSVLKRQAEFIAGRLCARSVLGLQRVPEVPIAIGTHREPLWPEGLIGSITHNGQYAAAIACPSSELMGIGIDIETIIKDDAQQAMVDLVVSAEEAGYLNLTAGGLSFNCLLTLVFSAKESFFKAAFSQVREYFDFDAVKVVEIDAVRRVMRFRCEQTLSERLAQGHFYDARFDILDSASIFTVVLLQNQLPQAARARQAASAACASPAAAL